jgi:two-component system KDP operon response regulator KdpE
MNNPDIHRPAVIYPLEAIMDQRPTKRILLVDNSAEYRRSVIGFLELEDYAVAEAGTLQQAVEMLGAKEFDLVLVDLRMRDDNDPNDMSGLEIAKFASEQRIPSIIVTAFPTVELARMALRSRGAEPFAKDLITKASGAQALLDSIRLTLAYVEPVPKKPAEKGLFIDPEKRLVRKDGVEVKVSPKQYDLLAELWRKDGGICSYAELFKAVYPGESSEFEIGRVTRIKKLVDRTKQKIEDKNSQSQYIETEFGRGYRLNRKS